MSLNGLDDPKIKEAYEAVLGGTGGWFLLKYLTRDEIELLKAGSGGFAEVRDAITDYPEKSPLYGLVQYRRKKVLLKYLPEGTSRLLQARLAVHVQAIIEKFAHDTLVSVTNPTELSETTFSSSITPLKASASITSSNSSLRRRRLTEIAEEAGDQGSTTDQSTVKEDKGDDEDGTPRPVTATNANVVERPEIRISEDNLSIDSVVENFRPRGSFETRESIEKDLPAVPTNSREGRTSNEIPFENAIWDGRLSSDRRQSSQSARPTTRELYEASLYTPKAKLGPRPSLEYSRTHSSSSFTRSKETRPVSTLPAGLQMPARKAVPERPQSQHTYSRPRFIDNARMPQTLPAAPKVLPTMSERPTSKAGSVASIPTFAYVSEAKPPTTTPEKQRLMKALQMRKKQMEKRPPKELSPSDPCKPSVDYQTAEMEKHESKMKALDEGAESEVDSDIVHVSLQDLRDVQNVNSSESPASLPEVSEGPSTKASSIADDDGITERQTSSDHTDSDLTVSEGKGSSLDPEETTAEHDKLQAPTAPVAEEAHQEIGTDDINKNTHEPHLPNDISAPSFETPSKSQLPSVEAFLPTEIPLPLVDEVEELLLQPSPTSTIRAPEDSDTTVQHTILDQHPLLEPLAIVNAAGKEVEGSTTRPSSTADSVDTQDNDSNVRRRGLVEPIRIVSTTGQSEENFLADDSFMEELQSATVEEAKPVSVSRSPISPVIPMSPKSISITRPNDGIKLTRTSSNPLDSGSPQKRHPEVEVLKLTTPAPRGTTSTEMLIAHRTVSSPLDNKTMPKSRPMSPNSSSSIGSRSISNSPTPMEQMDLGSATLPKKVGVGSLISQRIKALEKFTTSGSQASSPTAVVTPPLLSKRQDSLNTPSVTPSPLDLPSEGSRWGARKDLPYPTPSPSPHGTVMSRKFGSTKVDSGTALTRKKSPPDSISVTATIVRDPENQRPTIPMDPSEPVQTRLHHSPLTVQQHVSGKTSKKSGRSKPGSEKSESPRSPTSQGGRRDSVVSQQSTASRRGSIDRPPLSPISSDTNSSSKEDKRESRTTRLFKRMSALTSPSRRNIAQALGSPVREKPLEEPQQVRNLSPLTNRDFGDLNVQFPDTLLWKRRHMMVDSQGFLILSPSTADKSSRVTTKRYHLSEFRPPYIPDQDRQELPNSVILDFVDSSTLQCACENPANQAEVSRALFEAHQTHNSS
ncbi:hypothetical protein MMC30_004547 [Trapelia coarctata]|nr:hypothetical protein [Trapelia coarctata]